MIEELKKRLNFEINSVQFVKREGMKFLDIELPDNNLNSIEEKSKIISNVIDEIDSSDENYYLNVFSSGTEKEIEMKNIGLYVGQNVYVKINGHVLEKNEWEGVLIENNNDHVIMKINNKGRLQKIKISKEKIYFIKTTAKLRKVK